MSEEFLGFQTAPKQQIQAAFEEVARRSMHDLSFLHPNMPVYVSDFTLFEGQWTGCVITPDAQRADFPRAGSGLAGA